jgi:predicted PurR-regulated permease PerM
MLGKSAPALLGLVVNIGSGIINMLLGIIVSVYVLFSKEKFLAQARKAMHAFFPRNVVMNAARLVRTTDDIFGNFIIGKIIDSMIIGVLCFIGLALMNIPNAVLVSFIIGVTNIIPYFGPIMGAVPSFFLTAIVSPTQGILLLIFVIILQQIDGNIIGPMILGDSTGLPAPWVIFAILFFGGLFGVPGMFIGVPFFAVIYCLVHEAIVVRLEKKGLALGTEDYMQPLLTATDLEHMNHGKRRKRKPLFKIR